MHSVGAPNMASFTNMSSREENQKAVVSKSGILETAYVI